MKKLKKMSCWVVTEGIAGTENQCLGIAEALGVEPEIKRITLRQPWKTLSPYLGFERRWSFKEPLTAPWPDLVIAAGRKAIAAARYIKRKSNEKTFTVFVQDPRVCPTDFDLVIAPSHDPVEGHNVIHTLASPNRITPEKLRQAAKQFPDLATLPGPRVAVLIGGNSKSHRLTEELVRNMAQQLGQLEATLMITASRRTDEESRKILYETVTGENDFFWDGTGENPYFAMLDAADYIVVTNDSASMLSDAATTGKPVYMIPLQGGSKRLNKLHRNLVERGAIRFFDGKLEDWEYEPLNDAQKAAEAITQALYKD